MGASFTEPGTLFGVQSSGNSYSIGQMWLESATSVFEKVIEFGWIVDPQVYQDHFPHLFLDLRWAGSFKAPCFEGIPGNMACPAGTYVQLSSTYHPGMAVGGALNHGSPDVSLYHVKYSQGWWLFQYRNQTMGKVDAGWWGPSGFAKANIAEWWGEVASDNYLCTPMGTGIYATRPGAAQVSGMVYDKPNTGTIAASAQTATVTDSRYWAASTPSTTFSSFSYGGPYNSPSNTCQEPSAWGNAAEVPGSGTLNAGGLAEVRSVSCGSAGNCSAGGSYLDGSGNTQAFVVNETNGTWGNAVEVPGSASLNADGLADVSSVSCASAGNCSAGGSYADASGNEQSFVVNETNSTWGKAVEVPGTPGLSVGVGAGVTSVSCASAANCSAGGFYTDASGRQQPFVVSETNSSWGNAIEVPGSGTLNAGGYGGTYSVSCGSVGNCSAGGFYTDGSGHFQAFVVNQANGAWGKAVEVPGTPALNAGGNAEVDEVSCASAGNCSAGGSYTDGSGHAQAFVVNETNGTWENAVEVPGMPTLNAGSAAIHSVSCGSAGNCSAGGFYTDGSGHFQAFVVNQANGAWGKAVEVPGTPALNAGGNAEVDEVSCASAGNCSAGGSYADSSNIAQVFVVSETNGVWGSAIEVPGSGALNLGGGAGLTSMSCPSVGNCSAGGSYADRSHNQQAFVVNETNGS
jgi:hypothetical protein